MVFKPQFRFFYIFFVKTVFLVTLYNVGYMPIYANLNIQRIFFAFRHMRPSNNRP